METTSVINLLPSTKDEINTFVEKTINNVTQGVTDPLELTAQLKCIEIALERIKSGIKHETLREAYKHGKSFEFKGFKVEVGELGTKYDYSKCGDTMYNSILSIEKNLDKDKKDRETFLKSLKESVTIVDEETGETTKVHPPVKTSTTGLKFSLL